MISNVGVAGFRVWLMMMQGVPSTLAPHGTGARSIAGLGWFLIVVGGVTCLVVSALVFYAALRRRGKLVEHESSGAAGGTAWIHFGGIVVPAIVLAATFVVGLRSLGGFPVVAPHTAANGSATAADRSGELLIEVIGQQWWWQMRYRSANPAEEFETANELHVPIGRPVRVNVGSRDVIHSFWIPQLHPKMDLIPGRVNTVVFQADVPGEYRGECAEFCGRQHANMAFVVVAESEQEFSEWASRQHQESTEPTDSLSLTGLGQQVFLTHACIGCHTIRGTAAVGTGGPDLTHVASRPSLGAGTVRNTRGNLEAWILNAPALKPGVHMPRTSDLDGPAIQALVAYLETLQ